MQRHELADCEHCPLNSPDNAYVPTKFSDATELVVVGEAPGFYEAAKGRPFVGPSGKLLDQVLSHHGYRSSNVTYTNVVSCRPKDNATPPKAAVAACRQRLLHEIAGTGARDILALGGTAAGSLVDDQRTITSLRIGPAKVPTLGLRGTSVERVVPTWHPAYCLRTADAFPALVSDIAKLRDTNSHVWSAPKWSHFDDPALARQVIAELRSQYDRLVVDIEVGIEKDTAFDHPNEYDLLCVGIAYASGRAVVIGAGALADEDVLSDLRDLFRHTKLIAHNGKFDLAGLRPKLGELTLWFDTMLASYCLDERPGNHGLKVLAVEKLGAPQYDLEIKKYIPKGGNYANIPKELLYKYNAYDVCCTWDLYELFEERLEREDLRKVHDFLVRASNQLMYLELNGITIDREYQKELSLMFRERITKLEDDLDRIVFEGLPEDLKAQAAELAGHDGNPKYTNHINPRSPKQLKEYFETQGLRVAATDVDTLTRVLERINADLPVASFIRTLLLHRRQQKLYSTYVEGIRKRLYRGRVYTTYMLHGTTSGRLASRNPNLQNIVRDKDIRRQFGVSKPENVFIQCDYKQAEARVMATLAQDEYLREILSNQTPGYDFFNVLSDQLYGVGNWRKEVERIRTKAFFYGIGYGREPYSIGLEYGMTPKEAERQFKAFTDLIPATVAWQNATRRKVLSGDDLVTPFGRKRRFWLITEQNKKDVMNEALSYLPQSTSSDICLSALIDLRQMLRGHGFIRLTIHDAIVVECHADKADEVSQMMKAVMEEKGRLFTDYVPFPVDISIGKSWGEL